MFEGKAYKAPSGQWSWVILKDDEELVRGGGYDDEDQALEAMYNQLEEYNKLEGSA